MARFKKGQGGRPKGATNKTTKEVREVISNILCDNLEQLQNDIQELNPKERVKVLIDLAKFVVPTLKATDLSVIEDKERQPLKFEIIKPPIKWLE